jgi:hypothetical protein
MLLTTGIGRPADKRASHVLPRLTLGAAREAECFSLNIIDNKALNGLPLVKHCASPCEPTAVLITLRNFWCDVLVLI